MRYRAVLFDLDGTLIDSVADIAAATNRTLQAAGLPTHPLESYRRFIGDGVRNLLLRALPEKHRGDSEFIDRCLQTYAQDYGTNWCVKTCLYPEIPEMLDGLIGRGLKLTLLSNKPDPFTQSCAGHFLKRWPFEMVLGATARYPHKPDPTAALAIAERLGVAPEKFLYLGDMPVDMLTARNAGMVPVGATWGLGSQAELLVAGARHTIDTPSAFLEIADAH